MINKDLIERLYKEGIVFISPEYQDGIGDTTRIKTKKSQVQVEKNIHSVITNIAKFLFFDLDEAKLYYKDLLGKGRNIPLVFDDENIFFCLKTRIPIGKNDGAMTYINPHYIEDYNLGEVSLSTGDRLYTFTSHKTIKRQMKDCKFAIQDYRVKNSKRLA